jgi:ribose transport system permease protein
MNKIATNFKHVWARNRGCIFGYVVMIVVITLYIISKPSILSLYGFKATFDQFLTLTFAALAQTLVILTGGIDLSIGSVIGLTNSICAMIMGPVAVALGSDVLGVLATIIITLMCGLICGFFNGMIIVYGRLQPIVVTLATSFIFIGLGLLICPTPGGTVVTGFTHIFIGRFFGVIPRSLVWMLVSLFLIWLPLRRSRFGQSVYAIGGGEYASFISGIKVKRTKVWVYALGGLFCAISGVMLTATTAVGDPTGCAGFTLKAVAATVLGGTALAGGKGSFVGTIAGVMVYTLILALLIFWGVESFYQSAASGFMIIAALSLPVIQKVISEKKRIKT